MARVTATAPGKVMLVGEYAVLDGGRAIVAAIDRRAVATVDDARTAAPSESPFLRAARAAVAFELGEEAAAGFDRLTVDTAALRQGDRKLGVGSSAAATVAAIGAVIEGQDGAKVRITDDGDRAWRGLVGALARLAHGGAQGEKGARGSGADVAASTWGGVIDYRLVTTSAGALRTHFAVALPPDLRLHFAWTGQPADTATLVAAVGDARAAAPAVVDRALTAIAGAADAFAAATTAAAAIAAIADGGRAMAALAAATGVDLVPRSVTTLAAALEPLGAAAKTTGAGGGDVVLIAAPATIDRDQLDAAIIQAGLRPLRLALDPTGVDIRSSGA